MATVKHQRKRHLSTLLLAKIEVQPSGCWQWRGSTDLSGYGRFRHLGEHYAHRVAYRYFVGTIPPGMEVDHVCRNRGCVNPAHLEAVTAHVNRKRRNEIHTHCKNGHEFTQANTYTHRGARCCRQCNCIRQQSWRERQRDNAIIKEL